MIQRKRLALTGLISAVALFVGFRVKARSSQTALNEYKEMRAKYGLTLVVDSVPDTEMFGVEFFAGQRDVPFYAKSRTSPRNREILAFPGGRSVPMTVRVMWRKEHHSFRKEGRIRYAGEVAGDYIVPVGARIPEPVFEELRARGGNLRLKFRLKPDGVLFGWDIERAPAEMRNYSKEEIRSRRLYFPSEYHMVGGDFLDTRY